MSFGKSFSRELGKNTGKFVSNLVFGNKHATPHKIIRERQVQQRHKERIQAREYREEQKRLEKERREHEKELKRLAKEEQEEQKKLMIANNEVEVSSHNKYIEVIQSIHKDYSDFVDWDDISELEEPKYVKSAEEWKEEMSKSINMDIKTEIYHLKKDFIFSPPKRIFDKIFKNKLFSISKKIFKQDFNSLETLNFQINQIKRSKKDRLEKAYHAQEIQKAEYEENLEKHIELIDVANGILKNQTQSFLNAINLFSPFEDLEEFGSDFSIKTESNNLVIDFYVHSEEVIPRTTKKLLRKGSEVKEEPISLQKFNEIYQDYVCSCSLRIAKEIYQLLPVEKVKVNALGNILDTSTGKYVETPILSVLIERRILDSLNFDLIDPSDSMSNFKHNMVFNRKNGFSSVEII